MWQSPFNTVRSIQDSFEAFLESDEFLVELERWQGFSTEDPSVLDIVGMWLGQGENILLLESFDMLLLLVINLVEDWAGSGKTAVGGMPLWPDVAGSRTRRSSSICGVQPRQVKNPTTSWTSLSEHPTHCCFVRTSRHSAHPLWTDAMFGSKGRSTGLPS